MIWSKYILSFIFHIMKKILLLIALFFSFHASLYAGDAGVLEGLWEGAVEKIRNWDIHSEDIPQILKWATDYLMGFAATIAIIFIIIWAYKIAFGPLLWNTSEGKKTILLAVWWLILASVSWLILKLIIDNFA
mgnify:FL=1